ncbi:MAG: DUF5060 domain-containing protein, partial [Candidatus Sumerlaeia bacterium]|nr:DUF5060 domain-containing protein [Candidatus Sumerlaeia bacterium]
MMRFSAASYGFMILAVWWGVAPSYSAPETRAGDIRQWAVHEITLTASTDFPNPYQDVEVTAVFTAPDGRTQKTVHGFWDGGRTYKVRFTPTAKGAWTYTIQS